MPRRIQSLNKPGLQPQYAAASALDRTRGARLVSIRRLIVWLSSALAWAGDASLPTQALVSSANGGMSGLVFINDYDPSTPAAECS
jgi:hypothetical protein